MGEAERGLTSAATSIENAASGQGEVATKINEVAGAVGRIEALRLEMMTLIDSTTTALQAAQDTAAEAEVEAKAVQPIIDEILTQEGPEARRLRDNTFMFTCIAESVPDGLMVLKSALTDLQNMLRLTGEKITDISEQAIPRMQKPVKQLNDHGPSLARQLRDYLP